MRAVVLRSHGGPEVLTIEEVPDPVPGPDEVLVDVAATALNRADLLQRMGLYPDPRRVQPEIPGLEFAGTVAAVVVTWFTFLPSFIFILAGGPLIESTRNDIKFTAPLTAITGAVVGVILNLALFFGYHVLWPKGFEGGFEWISAVIAIGAAIALFRFKANVIHVILACALVGLLIKTVFGA